MSARSTLLVDTARRICDITPLSFNLGTSSLLEKALEFGLVFATSAFEDVANGGQLDLLIRIDPLQPAVLLAGSMTAEGKATFNFFRGPTVSADGTELLVRACNTTTPQTPTTRIFKNPTVTATGTGGESLLVPAGKTKTVGLHMDIVPVIVGPGDFLIRFANISGAVNSLSFQSAVLEYAK